MSHPIKSHSLSDIESAIAKAIKDLTGKEASVTISSLEIAEQSPIAQSLGRSVGAVLQLTVRSKQADPDYSKGLFD